MLRRPWRLIGLTLVLSILLVFTAGCQMMEPEPTPSPAEVAEAVEAEVEEIVGAYSLAATAWDLAYFGDLEEDLRVLPDTRASVTYFWDRYAGYDGCNWFIGVYSATAEGELRMQTPTRTRNVCEPPELYEQASMYVGALLNVTDYLLEGEQLVQNTVDHQRLLTQDPATPVPMPGTEWDLGFWWNAEREQWAPVALESRTFIVFSEAGEASGSGGCNDYTVSYEGDLQIKKVMEATDTYAELPSLTFGPIAAQMVECADPEGIMEQEQGYFTALGSVAYYFKLGGMQLMLDADGAPLLLFGARN